MKILVLGGSGFVSGTLVRTAISLGHEVWAVTRGTKDVPQPAHHIVVDRKNRDSFRTAIQDQRERWDLAVDCIGYTADDALQDLEVIAPLSSSLVFVSSDFVYDPASRKQPQNEHAAQYKNGGYGGDKRAAELELINSGTYDAWTVLRPCHIYGPGSLLGCLPNHGRDPNLIDRIMRNETLQLVDGGSYLQQPIYCQDLVDSILSCCGNDYAKGMICNVAGPEVIESRTYYRIIGEILGKEVAIGSIPPDTFLAEHPERDSFICNRVYSTEALSRAQMAIPGTPVKRGLEEQVKHLTG